MEKSYFSRSPLVLVLAAACAPQESGPAKAELPAGKAYAEGKEIYFVHAEANGEVTVEQPGAVIDMPFVVWDGGQR